MSPTRRSFLKSAVASVAAFPAVPAIAAVTPEVTGTPSEPTGATTIYTMQGFFLVDEGSGAGPLDYRKITLTVHHHEHWRDNVVDVIVTNPLRPEDMFDFRVGRRQGLSGVLADIDSYVGEQRRREREGGGMTAEQIEAHRERQLGQPA